MGIKGTYTVKSGDRITYISTWFNVTVQEIVNANPTIFTPDRIARTNQLIADETLFPGEMLIYPNETLNIPTGIIDELSEDQTIKVDNEDDLTIKINGKKCPFPHEFKFSEYFDTCSDSFSMVYPNDPGIKDPVYRIDPAEFAEKGLPDIVIYIGEDPVLTGSIEIPGNKITSSSSSQTLAGRSKTFLLEKSDFLPTIPREFLDQDLEQVSEVVTRSFSLGLEISDNVEIGENFPKATAEDNEKPFTFISRLARERSAVVSNTGAGKCLIRKAEKTDSVAFFKIDNNFLEFLGVESLEFVFDTTSIFGDYIGKTQTPDDQNLIETVQSRLLKQQSVKIISYQDADDKTLSSMTEWEEQKTVREFYKNSIPYPSWLNPNTGKRWKTGDFITIVSSEAGIPDPKELMIRQIDFTISSGDVRKAVLNILPGEVYL